MSNDTVSVRSPLRFFVLLFAVSIPFWLAGVFIDRLLPENIPIELPFGAIMTFNPAMIALLMVFRESGSAGVKNLLKRVFDFERIRQKIWYLPVFLLMPLIMVLVYRLMLLTGRWLPDPVFSVGLVPVLFVAFFVAAAGEELGWQGYAFEPLAARSNAFQTALTLGVIWAVWHVIPYFQGHHSPEWVLWQCGLTIALRVLIVWLYQNTGKSIFSAIVFHAMVNVSTFLFPVYGSHYDPFFACIVTLVAAATAVIIDGPKMLTRNPP